MEISNKKIILLMIPAVAIAISLGAVAGYLVSQEMQMAHSDVNSRRLDSKAYFFINPLLDLENDETSTLLNREIRELKDSIEEITIKAQEKGSIINGSVYYRDLNNGPWLLTGNDYSYTPASLFKVPVMIAFFKQAETDPEILNRVVRYEKAFENIPLHNVDSSDTVIEVGKEYSVSELIERMIIYSDNTAAYLLLENIDTAVVTSVFNDLDVPLENSMNIETFGPRTYASFLRILYNSTYLNKQNSEKALEILSRSTFNHGMRAVLLPDTKASIKYGVASNDNGAKQLHECGIIYWKGESPHILCIMTVANNFDSAAIYIQDVTKEVQNSIVK